jgi:hypothetical protein
MQAFISGVPPLQLGHICWDCADTVAANAGSSMFTPSLV